MNTIDKYIEDNNAVFLHSFDDASLFAGYGSLGLEILEEVPDPDVVLVCCGGGALVAGTAAGIKLSGHKNCRIYAIEPEGSRTMYESFKQGRAVGMEVRSVASGLSPPAAGPNAYKHCRRFVDDVILVSDAEIIKGMFTLYSGGLVVEPSGAAAFAALLHNKIPNVKGKKVVVVVTGGNVTPEELMTHSHSAHL